MPCHVPRRWSSIHQLWHHGISRDPLLASKVIKKSRWPNVTFFLRSNSSTSGYKIFVHFNMSEKFTWFLSSSCTLCTSSPPWWHIWSAGGRCALPAPDRHKQKLSCSVLTQNDLFRGNKNGLKLSVRFVFKKTSTPKKWFYFKAIMHSATFKWNQQDRRTPFEKRSQWEKLVYAYPEELRLQ